MIIRCVVPDNKLASIATTLRCNPSQLTPAMLEIDWNIKGPIEPYPSGMRTWLRQGEFVVIPDDIEDRIVDRLSEAMNVQFTTLRKTLMKELDGLVG